MSKKEIHFMAILSNTDSSILNVKLDHGFKIHAIPETEGFEIISALEHLPLMQSSRRLFMDLCSISDKKFYYIGNSFERYSQKNEDRHNLLAFSSEVVACQKKVNDYLEPVIRLMRLFKEGNVCMPVTYYYVIDNNTPRAFSMLGRGYYVSRELYALKSSEISDLQVFIQNTKLPFKESFLQLAFENFETSYHISNVNLSFLSLMISLETLFNSGEGELRYRISRNTATLLGKDKKDSKKIFSEVKDLYDKRSNIVHTGKPNITNNEDLLKLRYYVRESIKEINKIGKSKAELLDVLNSCGFGEKLSELN